jgi:hypothetical protein
MTQEFTDTTTQEYCYRHPNVAATLHCNRCERPICTQCAVLTPTGYRCRECVRSQQRTFETAQWLDYPLAFAIAAVLGYLGSLVASVLGFFTIFIAPIAGMIIAEGVRLVIRKRRSKRLFQIATLGAILGSLPLLLRDILIAFLSTRGGGAGAGAVFSLLPLVWQGLYTVMIASTVYYRLSGIQMRL